jgi:FMN phosphatase YigB (HAD superfamily)
MATMTADIVFLVDVDNTLFENDRFQQELRQQLQSSYGDHANEVYWAAFDQLRSELGYVDYLGALQRLRLEQPHDPRILLLANWLLEYPFADRLYPGALDAVRHLRQWGPVVILSDGDAVFQPHKIDRAGLGRAFDGNVLIYVHKEKELEAIERAYPARHYVLIDDKLTILDAVKRGWGDRVTTVFPRQGRYALEAAARTDLLAADVAFADIGDLMGHNLHSLIRS